MTDETIYWAHVAAIEGMGDAIFDELLKRFGSVKRALEAPVDEVREIPSMDGRTAEAICRASQTLKTTAAKIAALAKLGVRVVTKLDSHYPPKLRQAYNPPPVLYIAGEPLPEDDRAVAIIGSRDCTLISAKRARDYAEYLASRGWSIVSGYAAGIDLNAHLGALRAGGRTIIIPGCGAERFDFSPLAETGIQSFADLAKRGVWISEQPPDADWSGKASLGRNRLVAAQASAVIVIEARLNSSTMDTAARAQSLKRPLFIQAFATLSQRFMGNELLRREGAAEIHEAEDLDRLLASLSRDSARKPTPRTDDPRR